MGTSLYCSLGTFPLKYFFPISFEPHFIPYCKVAFEPLPYKKEPTKLGSLLSPCGMDVLPIRCGPFCNKTYSATKE